VALLERRGLPIRVRVRVRVRVRLLEGRGLPSFPRLKIKIAPITEIDLRVRDRVK